MVDADRLEAKAPRFETVRAVLNAALAADRQVLNRRRRTSNPAGLELGCADGDGALLLARAMIAPLSALRWRPLADALTRPTLEKVQQVIPLRQPL
uniref:Uncharacterized protein n=1 Tax=Streptomyces sp. NBC_00049 TaxID=2903617 RepID=A0AAU2JIG3_9ACTN